MKAKKVRIEKVPRHGLEGWIGKVCYAIECDPKNTWCILEIIDKQNSDPILDTLCSVSFPTEALKFIE